MTIKSTKKILGETRLTVVLEKGLLLQTELPAIAQNEVPFLAELFGVNTQCVSPDLEPVRV